MTNASGTGNGITGLVQRHPGATVSLIILLIGVLLLVFIFIPFRGEVELLDKLSRVEYARGVITFIFAIGTMGIAVILTIAGLQTGQDAAERFSRSKEVFTVLVGILGTILGFYFGTETARQADGRQQALELTASSFELVTDQRGTVIDVQASVTGGEPPYQYSITFVPPAIDAVEGEATDGSIHLQLTVPQAASGQEIIARLTVTDGNDIRVSAEKKLEIRGIEEGGTGA